jgi:hypothetical protein
MTGGVGVPMRGGRYPRLRLERPHHDVSGLRGALRSGPQVVNWRVSQR